MTGEYLNLIAEIRLAIDGNSHAGDDLLEVTEMTEAAEKRAMESGEAYLASKFHGLVSELEYLTQLTRRSKQRHLSDRYDMIAAECAMLENYLTGR